jgi:hypothetical protein
MEIRWKCEAILDLEGNNALQGKRPKVINFGKIRSKYNFASILVAAGMHLGNKQDTEKDVPLQVRISLCCMWWVLFSQRQDPKIWRILSLVPDVVSKCSTSSPKLHKTGHLNPKIESHKRSLET